MKKILMVMTGLLFATPALAEVPNDGWGVRKNGYCVIETNGPGGGTAYYYESCDADNVCCDAGYGTDCHIEGGLGEPSRFLPWNEPKNPPDSPSERPAERPER